MKLVRLYAVIILFTVIFSSCNKETTETDKQKPGIDLYIKDGFPLNCDTIFFGEKFVFKALLTDNIELGSFSIDIHHNFDHHSHSTEITTCSFDPIKTPVNPFIFIKDYKIPDRLKYYETNLEIEIPSANNTNMFDEGDYHFFISLTDKSGWSAQKGLSIKILKR